MTIPNQLTVIGNLTADPVVEFTQSGIARASFTVACSQRVKDGDNWKDGPTSFVRCTAWRQMAENVAESLTKGSRVIVIGKMAQREWEDAKTGEKRSAWDVTVDDVGPSLARATARVNKVSREGTGPGREVYDRSRNALADDPWATPAQQSEVPF